MMGLGFNSSLELREGGSEEFVPKDEELRCRHFMFGKDNLNIDNLDTNLSLSMIF